MATGTTYLAADSGDCTPSMESDTLMVPRDEPHAAERNRFLNAATRLFGLQGEAISAEQLAIWDTEFHQVLVATIEEHGLPGRPIGAVYRSVRVMVMATLINGYFRRVHHAQVEMAQVQEQGRLI